MNVHLGFCVVFLYQSGTSLLVWKWKKKRMVIRKVDCWWFVCLSDVHTCRQVKFFAANTCFWFWCRACQRELLQPFTWFNDFYDSVSLLSWQQWNASVKINDNMWLILSCQPLELLCQNFCRARFQWCDSYRALPSQTLTNTVGLGLFGDSSSVVLLICFLAPEVLTAVLSASDRLRASPCPDRMLIRTCFITANS